MTNTPTAAGAVVPGLLQRSTASSGGDGLSGDAVRDLRLDMLLSALGFGGDERSVQELLTPLPCLDDVTFRQEVFRDLEGDLVLRACEGFTAGVADVRRSLAVAARRRGAEQHWWQLDAVRRYGESVLALSDGLGRAGIGSRGLRAAHDGLTRYCGGTDFTAMVAESRALREELSTIGVRVSVRGHHVEIAEPIAGPDVAEDVAALFATIGPIPEREPLRDRVGGLGEIECQVLDLVVMANRGSFDRLASAARGWQKVIDPAIARLADDLKFFLAYSAMMRGLGSHGVGFTCPELSAGEEGMVVRGAYDIALCLSSDGTGAALVANDVTVTSAERVVVVTGPNQGGKTTYARMVGQLQHLASVGCPVPATAARMPLVDRVLTHFPRQENRRSDVGALESELARMTGVIDAATSRSVVVMNESFSSTTGRDGRVIALRVVERLRSAGAMVVFVTFLPELVTAIDGAVSLVATTAPDDPSRRTFRIERRAFDGATHAEGLAERFGLTYRELAERISRR